MIWICVVPIYIENYTPTTIANIETTCDLRWNGSQNDDRYKKVTSILLEAAKGEFRDFSVRIMIRTSRSDLIYVDNIGGIYNKSGNFKMSDKNFVTLKHELESLVCANLEGREKIKCAAAFKPDQ